MSTRLNKMQQDILPLLESIEANIKEINIKNLSLEDRDEVAHLKKVFAYLSGMIKSVDPDFVPMNSLIVAESLLNGIGVLLGNYKDSNNFDYMQNINKEYLDKLLTSLMPFIFYKGRAASALSSALNQYAEAVSEHAKSYLDKIKELSQDAQNVLNKIRGILSALSKQQEKFSEYNKKLFDDDGMESKISDLIDDFEKKSEQINDLYKKVFDPENGIKMKIDKYLSDGKTQNEELHSLKDDSQELLDELEDFHAEIFGKENQDGNLEGGLKDEISTRKEELDNFKIKQQQRYQELNKQIESLLPGATSAGLSSAYNIMYNKFNGEVKMYGWLFYLSLVLLLCAVFGVNFIPNIAAQHVVLDSSIMARIVTTLDRIIYKLPFVLPALWLAFYISRRRNESQRLAQEYAHKEALAKSYDSYKQQIEKLSGEESDRLLLVLMENTLNAIAFNPAKILDGNSKEPSPIEEIAKNKDLWEFIKNFTPTKKD